MQLIEKYPLKKEWQKWAIQEHKKYWMGCKTDEEFIQKAKSEAANLGGKQIHYGEGHSTSQKHSKLPEKLCVLLWLLRFGIHDKKSLNTMTLFFSPDTIQAEQNVYQNIFTPSWLKNNIVNPAMNVYELFKGEHNFETTHIFNEHYICDRNALRKCYRESILYGMVSQMIETIVAWGYPPNFPLSNQNTDEIKNFMRFLNQTQDNNIIYDLYMMFFSSIENIIEKNVKHHHEIIF